MSGGRGRLLALVLAVVLGALVAGSLCSGGPVDIAAGEGLRGALATFGLAERLPDAGRQAIVELRLWRALVTCGVGASLALSGGLIQGLFRNGLASPSLIGVTGGAALGAALAVLIVGGYAPRLVLEGGAHGAYLIPLFGFAGAMVTALLVVYLASGGGRTAVTTLLLTGIAVNMCVAGIFAAIQSLTLKDWEVSRAILAWTFGTLDDRTSYHAAVVGTGVAASALAIPFVARELDLFQGGEADAEALGVHVGRVKLLALFAAALSAACAVAVAGQIAFVGLVVPHLLRFVSGTQHRRLLPLCCLGGAVFLLGAEFLQRLVFGTGALQPGVLMSLVGGPFFLALLVRERQKIAAW